MLLGSEIGAALTALEPLGIDMIGLNCATGPAEMSEHLRYLARHSRIPLSCMPNAGLPVLGKDGAHYPLTPGELADAQETFVREYGLSLVGGCCGTTPEHLRQVVERVRGARRPPRASPRPEPGAASLYQTRPVPPGHLVPGDRRAHQRQRLEEVPRGHAGGPLGRLRGDGPRPDPRGRAHARPVRRLRRPGRRRRHGGAGRPLRHRLHPADRAGLHRGRRAPGRPGEARRPRGHQLRQLRGRRRPRVPLREGHRAGRASTAPR